MGQDFNGDYKRYSPISVDGRTVRFFAAAGGQLMLTVQSIDIPNTPSNWIQLHDGGYVSSPPFAGGILRGSNAPTTVFTSRGTDLTLSFHSDGSRLTCSSLRFIRAFAILTVSYCMMNLNATMEDV